MGSNAYYDNKSNQLFQKRDWLINENISYMVFHFLVTFSQDIYNIISVGSTLYANVMSYSETEHLVINVRGRLSVWRYAKHAGGSCPWSVRPIRPRGAKTSYTQTPYGPTQGPLTIRLQHTIDYVFFIIIIICTFFLSLHVEKAKD